MPTDRNLIKREVATYVDALINAAKSSDSVFTVNAQLAEAVEIVRGNMTLRTLLSDGTVSTEGISGSGGFTGGGSITPEQRAQVAKEVFASYDPSLVAVIALLAERGEMGLLSRIAEGFEAAAEEATGIVTVDVTTAVSLTDAVRETIKKKLSADFDGKEVMLREHIDKSILGGVILGAHGKRIDASVLSQLENARTVLSTVPGGEF